MSTRTQSKHQERLQRRLKIVRAAIQSATGSEKIHWREVRQRISQGDIRYVVALNIAKKEIEGFLV